MEQRLKLTIGVAIVGLVLIMMFYGATIWEQQNGPPQNQSDGASATNRATIDISPGQINTANDEVSMSVTIRATIYGESPRIKEIDYDDVMFCMYDRNGSLLHGENLGTISMRNRTEFAERYEVNVTLEMIPKYLLIDHPDFRNGSVVSTDLLEWVPDRETYTPRQEGLGEIQDRFEFPRTHEPGVCG